MIFFRLRRKLVKLKKIFSWKLQNKVFLHMQLQTTSLLKKKLPKEKLEVNPFQVPEIHRPLCLRPQPWANWNFRQRKKGGRVKETFKISRSKL